MDQTKIWDYFQNEEEVAGVAFNARPRYEFLAKQTTVGTNVLNIGVGHGGLEAILVAKGITVSCLDPSEAAINKIREKFALGERAKVGFSQNLPFADNQFDVVVMSEVLEHLTDEVIQATLIEIKRVLKTEGRFIGSVPADEMLLNNRVMCPHCGEHFHRWGHQQHFSKQTLQSLLTIHFNKVTITRYFFAELSALNWKGKIGALLKKLLVCFGVDGDGETFFFSAAKP
jgi:ubiquinone/menaquinone biosynthesis C-methylase UbiE